MMNVATGRTSRLVTLPRDLQMCILELLPDLESLACAAASCRTLHGTVKSYEQSLSKQVLINAVGSDVLPEAIMVDRCSPPLLCTKVHENPHLDDEQAAPLNSFVSSFLKHFHRPTTVDSTTWTIRDARRLQEFHTSIVVDFTDRFIRSCATTSDVPLGQSLILRTATQAERNRMMRAFYRYELFRKLLGYFSDRVIDVVPYAFSYFSRFATWEIAQLSCIHDFLALQIVPAFNELAKHDVEWSAVFEFYPIRVLSSPWISHFLALGLRKIHALATCDSYRERTKMLKAEPLQKPAKHYTFYPYLMGLHFLLRSRPFYDDGDSGAEAIWQLSSVYYSNEGFQPLAIYNKSDWAYRRWGYVLWDHQRLDDLGIIQAPWKPSTEAESIPGPLINFNWWASWWARDYVYRCGGRGWWDFGDEMQTDWSIPYDRAREAEEDRIVGLQKELDVLLPGLLDGAKQYRRDRMPTPVAV